MAAPCVRTAGLFLTKYGTRGSNLTAVTSQVLRRQMCAGSILRRRKPAPVRHEKFSPEYIRKRVEEYDEGKRHLANIMGEDAESLTQEDVDRCIDYLFPSSLFDKRARPLMKHPDDVFPKQKAAKWGEDKRPFHFLFYTSRESYYALMHEIFGKIVTLEQYQDRLRAKGVDDPDVKQISTGTTRWFSQGELEKALSEPISTHDYHHFVQLMERLLATPHCTREEEFVQRYRRQVDAQSLTDAVPELERDARGVAFCTAHGRRKTSAATVVLRDCGSGRVTVNGKELLDYFCILQDREQLMFPLQFTGTLGRFDLECAVSGGGRTGQAGALRLAVSRALLSFVPEGEAENMRQAGLLTLDPRVRERKKPGQEGARKKFTWKKR